MSENFKEKTKVNNFVRKCNFRRNRFEEHSRSVGERESHEEVRVIFL
jgi:hypothetical protein